MQRKIVLASSSSWRKRLLEQIGIQLEICESDFEEKMDLETDPCELAKKIALGKVQAVAKKFKDAIVIGGDTFVVFNNRFLGKPKDAGEAKSFLRSFSGKAVEAISGYAIMDTKSGQTISDFGSAYVKFRDMSDEEINDYVATGEPLDKAGSFAILGKGSVLIEKIDGDFYSIVALPINKIFADLKKMGVNAFKQ